MFFFTRTSILTKMAFGRTRVAQRTRQKTNACVKYRTHDLARNARIEPDRALCHMRLDADVEVRIYTDLTGYLLSIDMR